MTNSRPLRANGLLVSAREPDKVSSGWLRITPVGKIKDQLRVSHDQAVARQRQKLTADFGVAMHIAWTRHLLDNREFIEHRAQ